MAQLNVVGGPLRDPYALPPAVPAPRPPQLPATALVPVAPPTYRVPMSQKTLERDNLDACREFQAYYDEALCRHVGITAPAPKPGQDVMEYRTEACRTFKRTFLPPVHPLYKTQWRNLADDHVTLRNLEPQLMEACVVEAHNPAHVPKGELKEIKELNSSGQHVSSRFIGQEHFTKAMGRPGRRVTSFRGPHGYIDGSGRPLK